MAKRKQDWSSQIHHGDCVAGMARLPRGSVDLAFADPPFNIGYEYDVYDDRRAYEEYVAWSQRWISAVYDSLSPTGTFWLAIGDEYAAELKIESQKVGFQCRSWVIWYYTFGVNCAKKFTRSHAHLFHFVKDSSNFTFNDEDLDNRVPSARELVYNDKRANPRGRLPDDTWILRPSDANGELSVDPEDRPTANDLLPPSDENRTFALRPQELDECFQPNENTWYFPRVAGTFKERAGFHGCQMPEQLLGRIIRVCSNPGDLVLDPFSGSATTLAVAKKLGRQYVGYDVSEEYIKHGRARLSDIKVGDRLDGSAEPLKSAPKTSRKKRVESKEFVVEERYKEVQKELTEHAIVEAFRQTHDGFSADRVVIDPDLNVPFIDCCVDMGIAGDPYLWNSWLFRIRKSGKLASLETYRRTEFAWNDIDRYLFASEIAWQQVMDESGARSLDEILCRPKLAARFDAISQSFAPGFSSLEYRWAALKLRKEASSARIRSAMLKAPRFAKPIALSELQSQDIPNEQGLYTVGSTHAKKLHVGETSNLRAHIKLVRKHRKTWLRYSDELFIQTLPLDHSNAGKLTWQSLLVRKFKPRLNCSELSKV